MITGSEGLPYDQLIDMTDVPRVSWKAPPPGGGADMRRYHDTALPDSSVISFIQEAVWRQRAGRRDSGEADQEFARLAAGDPSLAEALSLAEVHYAKALSDLGISRCARGTVIGAG